MGIAGSLKRRNIRKRVIDMQPGERGYIDCDSLSFDINKVPYLDLYEMVVGAKRGDLEKVPILRTGTGETDFRIEINRTHYMWTLSKEPFADDNPDYCGERYVVKLPYENNPRILNIKGKKLRREKLTRELEIAVDRENFELAARIRNRLNGIKRRL